MKKTKIRKEINRLCSETIVANRLPKAYQTGLKMFKAEVVEYISNNFFDSKSTSEEIPTTWLDPLLTGKDKVIGECPYNSLDIEKLLMALKKRIENKEKFKN